MRGPRWSPDPVLVKELSGSARRWQTYAFRGVHVGLFILIVWALSGQFRDGRVWLQPSAYAMVAREIFGFFLGFQAALVILAGISAASDLVVKEVRLATLGLLVCTPLTPMQIAFGKWKAVVVQTGTLLLCGAPVLATCAYLGGASPRELICALTLTADAIALGAALSLLCSSIFRTGTAALMAATAVFAAYLFVPLMAELRFIGSSPIPTIIALVHLPTATIAAFVPFRGFGAFQREAWIGTSAATAIAIWILLRLTAMRIRALTSRSPAPPILDRAFEMLDRFYEDVSPAAIRKARGFADRTGVWDRGPLLWKELRTRTSGRLRNSVRISLVLLLAFALCLWLDYDDLHYPVWIATTYLWYAALANGSSLFVKEKEERKWDLLLATPLGSGEILLAKLTAGIVPVLPVAVALVFFWGLVTSLGRFRQGDFPVVSLATFLPAVLAYVLGAVCSMRSSSIRAAFTAALCGIVSVVVLLPGFASLSFLQSTRAASCLSPFWFIETLREHGLVSGYLDASAPDLYDAAAFSLLYGTLSLALLVYLYFRFDRLSGRTG